MPGPENDIPQSERARIMREDDARGDLERYAPALAVGRPPELTPEQKQQLEHKLTEASERARASTYSAFAQADANLPRDRFHQVNAGNVVGSKADIAGMYPAASAAHQTQMPPELPIRDDIHTVFQERRPRK
jgi:hypothetical protein